MALFSSENQPAGRGRPKGTAGIKSQLRRSAKFREQSSLLLDKLMKQALDGDSEATKLVASFIPKPKATAPTVKLDLTGDLEQQAMNILKATGQGELSPDTAQTLMALVKDAAQVAELPALLARLEALEENAQNNLPAPRAA